MRGHPPCGGADVATAEGSTEEKETRELPLSVREAIVAKTLVH